jgi:Dolichyl-phosphate-mannose-protein mannosyltransferase
MNMTNLTLSFRETKRISMIMIILPLILSCFSHLWNPIGFPSIHGDEGHYIRRALILLEGGPPQESNRYDHPFFGQFLLSGIFWLVGYPGSLTNSEDIDTNTIGNLFLVPRIIIGIFAVIDTFLIFKIAERRYNKEIGFIASIFFAVMPSTFFVRYVLLESIQLPFILLAILLAIYYTKNNKGQFGHVGNRKRVFTILLSGISLGIAIFTKLPAFTMIPLVGYYIFKNNNKRIKYLGLWFVPTIIIPLLWPAYAIMTNAFEDWQEGVLWQTEREGPGILTIATFLKFDPVLIILGLAGIVYSTVVRKSAFYLLWLIPMLIFFQASGFVRTFHVIPLLPLFCISSGDMIVDLSSRLMKENLKNRKLSKIVVISAIGVFGLVTSTILVTTNMNTSFFELYAFITQILPKHVEGTNETNDNVTVIGNNWVISSFEWIPNYVYEGGHEFKTFYSKADIETEKVLLIVDARFDDFLSRSFSNDKINIESMSQVKEINSESKTIKVFDERDRGLDKYPYINLPENRGIRHVEIKSNY